MKRGKIYIVKIIDEVTDNEIIEPNQTEKDLKVSRLRFKFFKRKKIPTNTILKVERV